MASCKNSPGSEKHTEANNSTPSDTTKNLKSEEQNSPSNGSFKEDTVITFHVNDTIGNFYIHYVPVDAYLLVEIKKTPNGKPFQIIKKEWADEKDKYFQDVEPEDVNFDGYQDMKFYEGSGANGFARYVGEASGFHSFFGMIL